jgi:hypothetical protein
MSDRDIILALQEQVGCYRRLAKLAELQHEHVQQSRTEALLDVLKSRQEVLNDLSKLESVIGPAKSRWSDFLGQLESTQRGIAEQMFAESRRLLERIVASDRNDALVLQQRKLNLGRQINQATSARQIHRTYATAAYGQKKSVIDVHN